MANHHDQIVNVIVAPQRFGAGRVGQSNGLIIGLVIWRVAPAVLRRQRYCFDRGIRSRKPIRAPIKVTKRILAKRGAAIAFLFEGLFDGTVAAKGAGELLRANRDNSALRVNVNMACRDHGWIRRAAPGSR